MLSLVLLAVSVGDPGRAARPLGRSRCREPGRPPGRAPGDFTLDIELTAQPGEVVALLGPNGAGKTTALRALAGLVGSTTATSRWPAPRSGRTAAREAAGSAWSSRTTCCSRTCRALDNVAFGPRCRRVPRREARERPADWLARVGLAEHVRKKPRQLSGGQAQRVALARALAAEPRLLLLDEPLAALDARTRLDTRAQLRGHLASFEGATVLVTHDPLDALMLADRLVIVEDGRVVQTGDAADDHRPAAHRLRGPAGRPQPLPGPGGRRHGRPDRRLRPGHRHPAGGDVFVAFPPSAVALYPSRPDGSPRNTWPAKVTMVARHGDALRDRAGRADRGRRRRHPGRRGPARPGPRPRGLGQPEGDRDHGVPGLTLVLCRMSYVA